MSFAINKKYVDRVVFGVNNLHQLKDVTNIKLYEKINVPKKISSKDKNLIIFKNW